MAGEDLILNDQNVVDYQHEVCSSPSASSIAFYMFKNTALYYNQRTSLSYTYLFWLQVWLQVRLQVWLQV